jgi:pyruvate dehydrogenase (quinone)
VDFKSANFAKLAEAVGIRGFCIGDSSNLKDLLATALRYSGPAIIDVVTNPDALALPPKIDAREVAGMACTWPSKHYTGDYSNRLTN